MDESFEQLSCYLQCAYLLASAFVLVFLAENLKLFLLQQLIFFYSNRVVSYFLVASSDCQDDSTCIGQILKEGERHQQVLHS